MIGEPCLNHHCVEVTVEMPNLAYFSPIELLDSLLNDPTVSARRIVPAGAAGPSLFSWRKSKDSHDSDQTETVIYRKKSHLFSPYLRLRPFNADFLPIQPILDPFSAPAGSASPTIFWNSTNFKLNSLLQL